MEHPPQPVILGAAPRARPARDPLAVALANASLLSAGYLMLRRRGLAFLTGLVTLVLLILLGTAFRTGWFEGVLVAWWALMIAHGWFLAGGRPGRRVSLARTGTRPGLLDGWRMSRVRTQRLVALGVLVPVLVVVGLLRADASGKEDAVTAARHSGNCAKALHAQDGVWFGVRLADSPLTKHGEKTVTACHQLASAKAQLKTGLTGDTDALRAGFDGMSTVLTTLPGHEQMVDTVLNGFLDGLPTKDDCHTAAITDWLRGRKADGTTLDRASTVVPKIAPAALVGCGNDQMGKKSWTAAKARYQQLLDQYPHDAKAATAKAGVTKAGLSIQLDHVNGLLEQVGSEEPKYCTSPARYSGAPAPHKGINKSLIYGNSTYTDDLPDSWQAPEASVATYVVCVGDDKDGRAVRTCPYKGGIFTAFPEDVTFHKIAIPVKVYELRTGRLVSHRTIQISGKSCPATLSYTEYDGIDTGPSDDQYVDPSTSDVRDAFSPLIHR